MKLASWNVNSIRVRLPQVLDWLESSQVDILGLQETKIVDEQFPREAFEEAGFHVVFSGQPTYNGVATISRHTPNDVICAFPDYEDPSRRVLAATYGSWRIVNLYVPNGKSLSSEKYAYKLEWLQALQGFLAGEIRKYENLAVIGDFNIAPSDRDVYDPDKWDGSVLVSEPERRALSAILELGFADSFRLFPQEDKAFSWWDYRAAAFRRNMGLRIDLILLSPALVSQCRGSCIDKAPRSLERPSDHTPVLAVFG